MKASTASSVRSVSGLMTRRAEPPHRSVQDRPHPTGYPPRRRRPVLLLPALDRRFLCGRDHADARPSASSKRLGSISSDCSKPWWHGNLLALQSLCHGGTPVGEPTEWKNGPCAAVTLSCTAGGEPPGAGRWPAPGLRLAGQRPAHTDQRLGCSIVPVRGRAATALPDLLQLGGVALGRGDAVVVGQHTVPR